MSTTPPPIDHTGFLFSLAMALAAAASPPVTVGDAAHGGVTVTGAVGNLWVLQAIESTPGVATSGPYAVLRPYGGPAPDALAVDEISVQVMTSGLDQSQTLILARRLFETLFANNSAGQKKARNAWIIAPYALDPTSRAIVPDPVMTAGNLAYEVNLIKPGGPPGLVGRDRDTGVNNCSFNFNVRYSMPPAASS